ncbi:HEXXH motif-containing putative peptide modification protein [Streptomyces sp. NPDC016469]|uniref:aKG-HExxH-type peptide beta-hydroxylase n=1 Tax=Streptomyces sp. NPDC016469 TaxID=3157191 RepID=UPI0033C5B921
MNELAAVLNLDTIDTYRRQRTAAVMKVLRTDHASPPADDDEPLPLRYALAHHRLEGAENAARRGDTTALNWYRNTAGPTLASLVRSTRLGSRIVIAPNKSEMIRGPHSDTPYYVLGPETTSAGEPLTSLTANALDHIATTGLNELVTKHAAVICLTGRRRPDQILQSFAITRLPATVFTDHTGDPAVLGRDLVHEAAHNWLNDALAALEVAIPDNLRYFSPWRGTERPAYGFLHACFAFPLTVIYATRILPGTSGAGHAILVDHIRQQQDRLSAVQDDFTRALRLVSNRRLREQLEAVFHDAVRAAVLSTGGPRGSATTHSAP